MRSVCDSGGSTLRKKPISGVVSSGLRRNGSSTGAEISTTSAAATMVAVRLAPSSQHATSTQALIATHVARRIR